MGNVINFRQGDSILGRLAKKKLISSENLRTVIAGNVAFFYKAQWKQSEPKGKTIYNIACGLTDPTADSLDMVARRAKIPTWYLLCPLPEDLLQGRELADLVNGYIALDTAGREHVLSALRLAAR